MSKPSTKDPLNRAMGDHTVFLEDPVKETLLSMVMALTGELCVLRDRLDAHERLLATAGLPLAPDQVDAFQADDDARQQRQAVRQRILGHVMRSVNERLVPDELRAQQRAYARILEDVQRPGTAG